MQYSIRYVARLSDDRANRSAMSDTRAVASVRRAGRCTLCVLMLAAAAACGSASRGMTGGPNGEVADAPEGMAGDGSSDAPGDGAGPADGAPSDAIVDYGWGGCGTEVVGQSEFMRGSDLAIGLDGTAYLSTFDAGKSWIARRVPGSSIDHTWFQFGAVVGVDDIAVHPDGRIYFLVSRGNVDLEPTLQMLRPVAHPLSAVTVGAPIHSAGALAFDSTGRLYVGSAAGGIWRVDLTT